jgi:hypothetical protein
VSKLLLIVLLVLAGCGTDPAIEESAELKLNYNEDTELEKELSRIDSGGEIILRVLPKPVPPKPRKTPIDKLLEIHKRLPKTTRTPRNAGGNIVKSREVSHTHHRVIPVPGSKLKPEEKDLFHHSFHYEKKSGKVYCVIANPGKGEKKYMTDVILHNPKGQTWARLNYDKKGHLSYTDYIWYQKDTVILTCRILCPDNKVVLIKYHNGYKP